MSSSRRYRAAMLVMLSKSFADWELAKANFEKFFLASADKALNVPRKLETPTQDEFAAHLLDVHREWCPGCPATASRARPDAASGGSAGAARAPFSFKQNQQLKIFVSKSTQTTNDLDLLLSDAEQLLHYGIREHGHDVNNENDDSKKTTPLSMTPHADNNEPPRDVDLSKLSAVRTKFIKVEVMEVDLHGTQLMDQDVKEEPPDNESIRENDEMQRDRDSTQEVRIEEGQRPLCLQGQMSSTHPTDAPSDLEKTNEVSALPTNHERHHPDIGCSVNDSAADQRPEERIPTDISGKRFQMTRHCEICSASTNDMSKHLERKHKLSKEERQKYILAARNRVPIRRRTTLAKPSSAYLQKRQDCPICDGKNYTSIRNHLEAKHGLDANKVAEIRRKMKQDARSNLKKKNQVSALPTKEEKNHSDIGCSVNESTAYERPEERIPIDFSVKRFQMTRRCEICSVSTNDMSKHLERKHKLSKEERQKYILAARNKVPIKRRTTLANPSSAYRQKRQDCPICDGKNYTSIRNHLEAKHRLDPEEVTEILKRMKQEAKSNLKKKNQVSALPTNHERDRPDIGCSVNNSPADQRTEEGIPTDISDFQSVRERTNQVSDVPTNHEQGADIGCIVNNSASEQRLEERIPFDLSVKRFRITRRCEICSASTNDMSKHLERKHKLSKEERQKYILAARGRVPIQRRTTLNNPSGVNAQKRQDCPICGGKNYTYLRNHLEGKHGLDPDQVAEIRKRMKQEKKKTS